MKTRRQFLAHAPLDIIGAVAACNDVDAFGKAARCYRPLTGPFRKNAGPRVYWRSPASA